ncbi:hypothetical protein INT45_013696 [Circinella minor]|uniref:Embryonic stem cell-specific 5-hydroxymethylcytosine-binding protein n=1 Tax=Circinella minor TaxID=1195481 RepID=A0A8H7SBF9_9FUNG|nr:hypothetical protein INT45_013696 [Circinella minor]
MCGRFACSLCPNIIKDKVKESNINITNEWVNEDLFSPSFNVGPRKYIPVIRKTINNEVIMQSMQWGFIPSWTKDYPDRQPINARSDTLIGSSLFDQSKNKGRCIIVAEGFYEWKVLKSGKKIPYYTKRKDGKLMFFAGLYALSHIDDKERYTCTIVTTDASSFFEFLHDRMPVILENSSSDVNSWISNESWSKDQVKIMHPFTGELDCYQVTDAVGSTRNNSPDFIIPVDQLKGSISNFFKKETKPWIMESKGIKRERMDSSIINLKDKKKQKITSFFNKQ